MVWWVWFRLRKPVWVPRVVALLTLGFMFSTVVGEVLQIDPDEFLCIKAGNGTVQNLIATA